MRHLLYRILGNDLPPRHPETQTEDNLKFILDNEPEFRDCEKRFVLNRIADPAKVERICELLHARGYKYETLVFDILVFDMIGPLRHKMMYLTNVNPARNYCIKEGLLEDFEYVLPMDGGMYFRQDGWDAFDATVGFNPGDGFFAIPTWRVEALDQMLTDVPPNLKCEYHFQDHVQVGMVEYALAFGQNSDARLDERLMYGEVDKVELLWRLGLHGVWDMWEPKLRKEAIAKASKFYGNVKGAGFVCRLPSGNPEADNNNAIRGAQRSEGMQILLDNLMKKK